MARFRLYERSRRQVLRVMSAYQPQKTMKKPAIDIVVVMTALLLWANCANARVVPDGGASSLLFVVGISGLAMARKFFRK